MMREHITTTVAYASAFLTEDYVDAIEANDEAQTHMVHMGQLLSDGIIAQFPDKF